VAWGSLTPTFRDYLSVPSSRVKLSLDILTLKYGKIGSPKTSVSNNITPRNNPNDRKIQGFVYFRENGQDEGGGGGTNLWIVMTRIHWVMDRESSVAIGTRYGLESLDIESRWGQKCLRPSRLGTRHIQPLHSGYWVSFPGIKRPGRAVNHLPISIAKV
jgi:hypothetical protein